jgi:osmotically-inducible protein OsmY
MRQPSVNVQALIDMARALLDADKGLLAMDESNPTRNERFAKLGIPQTEEARRAWRWLSWGRKATRAVTAVVCDGWVTLEDQVDWNFEREAAERAVRYLTGVVSVSNSITLKKAPEASATQVKEKVEAALQRQATTDANSIHVGTNGSQVTLTGHASSWQSVVDASNAAWAAAESLRSSTS